MSKIQILVGLLYLYLLNLQHKPNITISNKVKKKKINGISFFLYVKQESGSIYAMPKFGLKLNHIKLVVSDHDGSHFKNTLSF